MAVAAVKLRQRDDALRTDVLRVVGYRASCDCGYIGVIRPTYADARMDSAEHKCGDSV